MKRERRDLSVATAHFDTRALLSAFRCGQKPRPKSLEPEEAGERKADSDLRCGAELQALPGSSRCHRFPAITCCGRLLKKSVCQTRTCS